MSYKFGLSLAFIFIVVQGCGRPQTTVDPKVVAEFRSSYILTEEPAGAQAVLDVREVFTGVANEENLEEHLATEVDDDQDGEEEIEFSAEDFVEPAAKTVAVSLEPREVVVVGRIGGMPNPWPDAEPNFPWKEGEATFFLVDPATAAEFADSGHEHGDVCDCPFCARAATENTSSVAIVNFVNPAGKVVNVGAQPLLDAEPDSTVVVQGTARMVGGEMLVINADGVYIRR